MSLQVRDADIRERVARMLANTLALRHGAAAGTAGVDVAGAAGVAAGVAAAGVAAAAAPANAAADDDDDDADDGNSYHL